MARIQSDDDLDVIADINITPFVDIVLVLLVIFMVTAGIMLEQGFDLTLPEAATAANLTETPQLRIFISRGGDVMLNDKMSPMEELTRRAIEVVAERANPLASVSADREVSYDRVVQVLDQLRLAGISDFALQLQKIKKEKAVP